MTRCRWCAGLLSLAACIYYANVPWVSAAEFRAQVEREVPPGTPKPQVSAWLRAKGYTTYDLAADCCESKKCVHSGEFSNYRFQFLFPTVLCFSISFDDQGRRTSYLHVREFQYCP